MTIFSTNKMEFKFWYGLLLLLLATLLDSQRNIVNGWTIYVVRSPAHAVSNTSASRLYHDRRLSMRSDSKTFPVWAGWFANAIESFFTPIFGLLIEENPARYEHSRLDKNTSTLESFDQFRIPYSRPRQSKLSSRSRTTTISPAPLHALFERLQQSPFYIRHAVKPMQLSPISTVATLVSDTVATQTSLGFSANEQQQQPQSNTCQPKRYQYPLRCPQKYGFFQLGQTCYYISSIRSQ